MTAPSLDHVSEDRLTAFCQHRKIVALAWVDAVDESPVEADDTVGVLATFAPDATRNAHELRRVTWELEAILGAPVRLLSRHQLLGQPPSLRRDRVLAAAETFYQIPHWGRDQAILLDMKRAAWLALQFVQGLDGPEHLQADLRAHAAVCYQLVILGEAARELSSHYRVARAEVDWSALAHRRDDLLNIDRSLSADELWEYVRDDVPALLGQLEFLRPGTPSLKTGALKTGAASRSGPSPAEDEASEDEAAGDEPAPPPASVTSAPDS